MMTYAFFFGLGEAVAGVADASWKIIAVQAIEGAKLIIVLVVVVVGLIVLVDRFMKLAGKFAQDNVFTVTERVVIVAAMGLCLSAAAILLPLGFALLRVVFG